MSIPAHILAHARKMANLAGQPRHIISIDDEYTSGRKLVVREEAYVRSDEFEAFFGAVEATVHPDGSVE